MAAKGRALWNNIMFRDFKAVSSQGEGQLIDDYVTELKARSQHCEFGDLRVLSETKLYWEYRIRKFRKDC